MRCFADSEESVLDSAEEPLGKMCCFSVLTSTHLIMGESPTVCLSRLDCKIPDRREERSDAGRILELHRGCRVQLCAVRLASPCWSPGIVPYKLHSRVPRSSCVRGGEDTGGLIRDQREITPSRVIKNLSHAWRCQIFLFGCKAKNARKKMGARYLVLWLSTKPTNITASQSIQFDHHPKWRLMPESSLSPRGKETVDWRQAKSHPSLGVQMASFQKCFPFFY